MRRYISIGTITAKRLKSRYKFGYLGDGVFENLKTGPKIRLDCFPIRKCAEKV